MYMLNCLKIFDYISLYILSKSVSKYITGLIFCIYWKIEGKDHFLRYPHLISKKEIKFGVTNRSCMFNKFILVKASWN